MARLFDHLRRLGLGLFKRLGVFLVGVGDLLLRHGMVLELGANGLLLVLHHGANRRNDVLPEEDDDDRETNELSDESRHRYRPCPVDTGTVRVVTSTPSTRLARFAANVSTDDWSSPETVSDCWVNSSLAC